MFIHMCMCIVCVHVCPLSHTYQVSTLRVTHPVQGRRQEQSKRFSHILQSRDGNGR